MRRFPSTDALPFAARHFLTSVATGLTAIGIVNHLRWLRAPVTGR